MVRKVGGAGAVRSGRSAAGCAGATSARFPAANEGGACGGSPAPCGGGEARNVGDGAAGGTATGPDGAAAMGVAGCAGAGRGTSRDGVFPGERLRSLVTRSSSI